MATTQVTTTPLMLVLDVESIVIFYNTPLIKRLSIDVPKAQPWPHIKTGIRNRVVIVQGNLVNTTNGRRLTPRILLLNHAIIT